MLGILQFQLHLLNSKGYSPRRCYLSSSNAFEEVAAHSNILSWKIPWTAEPGRLPSMGSQRVRHDWATLQYFWTVVLEKTFESPLDCKEIQPVHPKGDQSWVFIGRMNVEAETWILWPPDAKNWLIWKDLDLGKIGGKLRRGWQKMR